MDFLTWWQTLPSQMDPVLISIGPLTIYWYSTMYLVAFGVVYILCSRKIKQKTFTKINLEQFEDLLSWCFIGLLIGARFGYVFFYNFEYYLSNPLEILLPFKYYNGNWIFTGIAGMSYHGGVIGVVTAIWLFSRKLYLGRTVEYTETHNLVPMLEGRSSVGRLGLFVHVTAGFGDVGFKGYWTLEIFCVQPIKIYPSVEICQIFYHSVEGDVDPYKSGKYQGNKDIQASMLYKDFKKDE